MKNRWLIGLLFVAHFGYGQLKYTFSGMVLDREQSSPIHGVYIFNLNANRESVTDSLGFFTVQANAGDTLLFKDLRYKSSLMVVPAVLKDENYGLIQLMTPMVTMLDEVRIFSFPTQEEFMRRFMEYQPEPNEEDEMRRVQNELMDIIKESYPTQRYYYQLWADKRLYELTGKLQPNHLLDPFRWTEFIRYVLSDKQEIKKGNH